MIRFDKFVKSQDEAAADRKKAEEKFVVLFEKMANPGDDLKREYDAIKAGKGISVWGLMKIHSMEA